MEAYDVVRLDALVKHILTYNDTISGIDRMDILKDIDRNRVN